MKNPLYFAIPGELSTRTGGYAYDRRLIEELSARDLNVTVLALSPRFPFPDAHDLEAADATFASLPDGAVVLVDGLAFGAMEEIALRHGSRLRFIALCHHPLALESGLSDADCDRFLLSEAAALSVARAIVVTSDETKRILKTLFSTPDSKILVALPGTDEVPFAPCEGNPPVVLCVATLTRRKGHDVLIEALSRLRDLPWQARFVGGDTFDPGWVSHLHERVAAAGLEARIYFTGSLEDVTAEYRKADLFVLPTLYEGYGMVIGEALAHGLPVVTSDIAPLNSVVPRDAGVLIPPGDAGALSKALAILLQHPGVRQKLGDGARQAAALLPRWTDCGARVATLVDVIAQRRVET